MTAPSGTSGRANGKGAGDRYVLYWKPAWITFGLGPLALIALSSRLWLPRLNVLLGYPFRNYLGLAQLILVVLGFALLLIALPLWKPAGWSPAQDDSETDETP